MLLVTSDKSKQLLYLSYIGQVRLDELQRAEKDLTMQMGELSPGFRVLADFSRVESIGLDCAPELGRLMDLIGLAGVGLVVRVIPDLGKDIGLNILTVIHYPQQLQVITCKSVAEAIKALAL